MNINMLAQLNKQLAQGNALVLATIVTTKGSTPRKAGSQMLIFQDGTICGSVGGGLIEAQTIKEAEKIFQNKKSGLCSFSMDAQVAAQDGMACGGWAEIFLKYLSDAETC